MCQVRQELPEVKSRQDLLTAAEINGATLSIVDCQSLDRERMAMTLELSGTQLAVQKTIATLRSMTGVSQAYEVGSDSPACRVLMTLLKPRICQTSEDDDVMCRDCPFDSAEVPMRWRFNLRRTGNTGELISKLGDEGAQANVEGISPTDTSVTLSPKERGIIAVAIERGYFEFPRRITLEGLSQLVGVEPSMLRRLFRSVE